MSEGDVSLIRDEDLLRRMWQQTEDFSRKKEIRAHMYRLREERLRNLYSPDPASDGKDLKELSNAGWNVESENKTTDDGHTHVKSVNANIEGRYDVEGGKGQFAAVDHHRQAVTEYQDENSSLKRNESSSNTAAHEQVVRRSDDGTHFSSTTSSTSSSKYQQVSTKHETVPYTIDDYDQRNYDTNRNEQLTRRTHHETNVVKNSQENGELVSRKVEYPDDNTRVIVETRCLPDGTRVTSTRREFRAPVQSTRSEQRSQTRTESKHSTLHKSDQTSTSNVSRYTDNRVSDIVDSQRNVDDQDFRRQIIKYTDNDDHSETQSVRNYETNVNRRVVDTRTDDNYSQTSRYESKINKKVIDQSNVDDYSQTDRYENINRKVINNYQRDDVDHKQTRQEVNKEHFTTDDTQTTQYVTRINKVSDYTTSDDSKHTVQKYENVENINRRDATRPRDQEHTQPKDTKAPRDTLERVHTITRDTDQDAVEKVHIITRDKKEDIVTKKTTTDQYQTTYTTDYTQKKISTDWSPTHTAWASTLRSDTPSTTRPSTRASSPGSRTFKSSTSSLRSSVSPDKKKPSSRGGSPNKMDRYSPSRTVSDRYTTHTTHHVTETKTTKHTGSDGRPPTGRSPTRPGQSPDGKPHGHPRTGISPEKKPQDYTHRPSASPERKPSTQTPNRHPTSPTRHRDFGSPKSPRQSPERKPSHRPSETKPDTSSQPRYPSPQRSSPDRKVDRRPKDSPRSSPSPDRRPGYQSPSDRPRSNVSDSPRVTSPTRPHPHTDSKMHPRASPERKPMHSPDETDRSTHPKSVSPDDKPGYMQPTAASKPDDVKSSTKPSSDRKSPSKVTPETYNPDGTKISSVKEVHQKFVDEEIKTYTQINRKDSNQTTIVDTSKPQKPNDMPYGNIPGQDIPNYKDSPRDNAHDIPKGSIPSDKKKPISADITDVTTERTETAKEIRTTKTKDSPRPTDRQPSPTKDARRPHDDMTVPVSKTRDSPKSQSDREPSPSKYGTYDKKKPLDSTDRTPKDQEPVPRTQREPSPSKYGTYDKKQPRGSVPTSKDHKDTPSRESSPTKYGTYDRKRPTEETPKDVLKPKEKVTVDKVTTVVTDDKATKYDSLRRPEKITRKPGEPGSPTKKSPRDSTSPAKSPVKETKYKHTTDFISTERTTEETNKKHTTKERPRQLITPSSSPTRKPKPDTEPSTGQSSPTTSVSGFVYFSSPRQEQPVTDLDDQCYTETTISTKTTKISNKPGDIPVDRTPSPSKIPCRSPSPEKRTSPSKDSLPRKSSLKKPSDAQTSPSEKPPSSFRVSPDDREYVGHDITKKDRPEPEGEADSPKGKPPLERRETYEDRCRKILGMIDTTETTKVTTEKITKNSPEDSPSHSPKDTSPFKDYPSKKDNKTNVLDFISHEKEELVKTNDRYSTVEKSKGPRDTSPTKLQDIIKNKKIEKYEHTTEDIEKRTNIKETNEYTKDTAERIPRRESDREQTQQAKRIPTRDSPKTTKVIKPDTVDDSSKPKSSDSSPRDSLSPERKPSLKRTQEKPGDPRFPKESSPTRPGYVKSTTVSSRNDTEITENTQETVTCVISEKKYPSRSSESPTRKPLKPEDKPRSTSPSKTPGTKTTTPKQTTPSPKSPVKKQETKYPDDDFDTPEEIEAEFESTVVTTQLDTHASDKRYENISVLRDTKQHTSTLRRDIHDKDHPESSSDDDVEEKPESNAPIHIKSAPTKDVMNKRPKEKSPLKDTTVRSSPDDTTKPVYSSRGSPERPLDRQRPTKPISDASDELPSHKAPRDLSPSHPEYSEITTVVKSTDKQYSAEDVDEVVISKTVGEKYPRKPSESPTCRSPDDRTKASAPSAPRYPKEESPERKPSKDILKPTAVGKYPEDTLPQKNKYNKTTTDDVYTKDVDDIRTLKTKQEDYPLKPSDSPTHRGPDYKPGSGIPTRSGQPKEVSPEKKTGYHEVTKKDTKTSVKDFISHEKEELVKTTIGDRKPDYQQPAKKIPGGKYPTEQPISSPGYTQTTTIISSTNVSEKYPQKPVESPTNRSPEGKPKTTAPIKPGDTTVERPDKKPSNEYPTKPNKEVSKTSPTDRSPDRVSPSRTEYKKTTTISTTDHQFTAEDLTKMNISKTVHEKRSHTPSESPYDSYPSKEGQEYLTSTDETISYITTDDVGETLISKTEKHKYPKDNSHEMTPGKGEPDRRYPEDSKPSHIPGYMKTTTAVTSKHNSSYATKDIEEYETSRTVEEKHLRKTPTAPGSEIETSPSDKTQYPKRVSPERKPGFEPRSSPSQEVPAKTTDSPKPENRYPKESSPTRSNKHPAVSRYDTYTIEDIEDSEETRSTHLVEEHYPRKASDSPTRRSQEEKPKASSPTKFKQPKDESPERKPGYSPTSPKKMPKDLQETTSFQQPKTPGYMRTTTSATTKHEIVEDVEKTSFSKSTHEKYPTKPTEVSPSKSRDSSPEKSPKHPEITSPTKKEPQTKRPEHPKSRESSPIKTDKTPGYIKTTTTKTSKSETLTAEDVNKTSTIKSHTTRKSESPSRQSPDDHHSRPEYTRQTSPDRTTKKSQIRSSPSPDRKPSSRQPSDSARDAPRKKLESKYPREPSPAKSVNVPGYIKTTITTSKHVTEEEDLESNTYKNIENKYPKTRPSISPTRDSQSPTKSEPESRKPTSPVRYGYDKDESPRDSLSPERSPEKQPKVSTPGYMKTTTSITSKYDTSSVDIDESVTTKLTEKKQPSRSDLPLQQTLKDTRSNSDLPHYNSPSKPSYVKESPIRKPDYKPSSPSGKEGPKDYPSTNQPGHQRPSASLTTKYETTSIEDSEEYITTETADEFSYLKSRSPTRKSPEKHITPGHLKAPQETRQLRTPSPIKKISEVNTDFILSEREQEVLDKVQKSLRKLSPERKEHSPIRERSPGKTTTSLHDLDIRQTVETDSTTKNVTETSKRATKETVHKLREDKTKDQKIISKPLVRNESPTKKFGQPSSPKLDKAPDSPTKTRSISPRKPISERPQSPQMSKTGVIRKEPTPSQLIRKPTPVSITTSKVEKAITTDVKKLAGTTKQTITKTTVKATASKFMSSTKTDSDVKRAPTPKGIKETLKKEIDTKVTRTVSDINLKGKKGSPQRIKSKPEIQVSDLSSTKSPKSPKTSKEPQTKFTGKPKSATALNTSVEEDDIIIDVQQSKSSRENSPDRICPTPVNFSDDVGTPRFPDQVSEPDDDLRKRTYHTIHETESIVDDIVEICEDDELFVKRTDVEEISEYDDSQLSVHDKVSKFTTRIQTVPKTKDSTNAFKDTEIKVHSDFIDEKLKSDECLLSVSEKVNKFAKGPRNTKDSRSPSRKIVDEYDRDTIYQDDYTKLSVNDKAHLFVETAEHAKAPKVKPVQKVERPDLTDVDESLRSDDCLLSVSDKVNKFVKTAEQFLTESHEVEEKDKKIKEQHEKIMRQIVDDSDDETTEKIEYTQKVITRQDEHLDRKSPDRREEKPSFARETTSSHAKVKEHESPNTKPTERTHPVKITTLRSSEAVKKAKALFENIATTTQKTKEIHAKTTKLTDIGVQRKPKDSAPVPQQHPEGYSSHVKNTESEVDSAPHVSRDRPPSGTPGKRYESKSHSSPDRLRNKSPEVPKAKSPVRQTVETTTTTKTVLTRYPTAARSESPKQRPESDKADKVPGYLRPTKTSQIKEEKVVEETEVSSRRGSGKFGVELRRTSVERSTVSSERRRSVEHPCIEDIFDLDLLEQMLEKVVGYEQRRRIRAQIRVAKKAEDTSATSKVVKTSLNIPKSRSPEPHRSPDRTSKGTHHRTTSPERKSTPQRAVPQRETPSHNGHARDTVDKHSPARRSQSPEKPSTKTTKTPVRQPSPDKKTRAQSPNKVGSKPKANRFNEYASAYMKKVGLNETDKAKSSDVRKKSDVQHKTVRQVEETTTVEKYTSECIIDKTPSGEVVEVVHINGKRSPSPEKRLSPERKVIEKHERTPSPQFKRQKSDTAKKETIIKTVYDIEKKIPQKQVQEEKPSWVTNRNLKKITSETRTFSTKKMEPEKPKYRSASPSKAITKPIDVITSSYGPGPLDADGKPLFGIKALRNGSSNYQVKGTVIRQEFHSRNGGEPEGTVSVTAYSTEPEELEKLLQTQGAPPSRIHGLAAITTTKKFGGDTGTTIHQAHGKEERAALDQFTHSDRRVIETIENVGESRNFETKREQLEETRHIDREEIEDVDQDMRGAERIVYKQEKDVDRRGSGQEGRVRGEERRERVEKRDDKKTVRQSSVKSLTEKYIKSASESSKTDRSTYPKAGLILRTATMKDSVSSDSSAHAGLTRTDSEHSLGSGDDTVVTTTTERVGDGMRTTTTTTTRHHERSFLDSNAKVTGVQDILTRMKNADIVIQEGDTSEDTEARALLNKFLGATVLMAGMQGYVTEKPTGKVIVKQETVRSSSGGGKVVNTRTIEDFDVDQCWDERVLRKLLDECTDYEQRRRLRARIRTLMAEQEACTSAVTEALAAAGESGDVADGSESREEEEVTITSSVRRNSSEKTVSSSTTTKTSKVVESMTRPAPKPVSPFAKFRQLEKQNSTNSPKM